MEKKSGDGAPSNAARKYKYSEAMEFLLPHIHNRETSSILDPVFDVDTPGEACTKQEETEQENGDICPQRGSGFIVIVLRHVRNISPVFKSQIHFKSRRQCCSIFKAAIVMVTT
ncbi:uncharacterized protein LOC135154123 [Lytechinus pictus]|uniref:uncharacterized protein LOC135154123 n=1 Tax=Lytechinus pictus TaxID=7653 RepID=UPI0030B9C6B6